MLLRCLTSLLHCTGAAVALTCFPNNNTGVFDVGPGGTCDCIDGGAKTYMLPVRCAVGRSAA